MTCTVLKLKKHVKGQVRLSLFLFLFIFLLKEAIAIAFKYIPLDEWVNNNNMHLNQIDKIIIINLSEYMNSGLSSGVFLFILFKMKRIEIQLNPNYRTAQEIIYRLRNFICLQRILILIYAVAFAIGTITLIYVFCTDNDYTYYQNILFIAMTIYAIIIFIFINFLQVYFYKMGIQYIKILS